MNGEIDFEGTADALYSSANLTPAVRAEPAALAKRLLGAGCLRWVPERALPGAAALARVSGQIRIYLAEDLPAEQERWAIAHELAHWTLGPAATEGECDALGARLLLPRRTFVYAAHRVGPRWTELALLLGCSESCAALRWGETLGTPLALISPERVRLRGSTYSWPIETQLREIAAAPTSRPGLARARLRDDRQRVVLRAA